MISQQPGWGIRPGHADVENYSMSRSRYRPDPASAWPKFAHPHERGHRAHDCQFCGSPRLFVVGWVRKCASCGYEQQPSGQCLDCRTQLNERSRELQLGLCHSCQRKGEDDDPAAERRDWR
ncbi:hypothetical protein [Streptomyces sp. NPDC045470]|uniref:hypothetical protein n=1 Tax=Streptomyces sp. NPDC045470 TaxID=3155469 RepID=UPI0033DE68A9